MNTIAVQEMTEADARKLTERIRIAAVNYTDAKEKLVMLVAEAKAGSAHLALGFDSWTGYLQDVLSGEPLRLARTDRREVVGVLADEGVPNTVIATTLGIGETTVRRDLESMSPNGEIERPRTVTKTDGKIYTVQPRTEHAPADPPKPKRQPLPEQFFNAVYDLKRNIERVKRLTEDDRFATNKEKVALQHESDLLRAAETLSEVLQSMNTN